MCVVADFPGEAIRRNDSIGQLKGRLLVVFWLPGILRQIASFGMDLAVMASDLCEIAFLEGQRKGIEELIDLGGGLIGQVRGKGKLQRG